MAKSRNDDGSMMPAKSEGAQPPSDTSDGLQASQGRLDTEHDQRALPPEGYRVGYQHPPFESRFRKGKSGNPKGRPSKPKKKHLSQSELLRRLFSEKLTVGTITKTELLPLEIAFRSLVKETANGNVSAAKALLEMSRQSEQSERDAGPEPIISPDDAEAILAAFVARLSKAH